MELKTGCGQGGLSDELGSDEGRKASSNQWDRAVTLGLSVHAAPSPSWEPQGEYYTGAWGNQGLQRQLTPFIRQVFNTQVSSTQKLSHNF